MTDDFIRKWTQRDSLIEPHRLGILQSLVILYGFCLRSAWGQPPRQKWKWATLLWVGLSNRIRLTPVSTRGGVAGEGRNRRGRPQHRLRRIEPDRVALPLFGPRCLNIAGDQGISWASFWTRTAHFPTGFMEPSMAATTSSRLKRLNQLPGSSQMNYLLGRYT